MGTVCERVSLHCPYGQARLLLRSLVEASMAGQPHRVTLSVGTAKHQLLHKDVLLRYDVGHDPLKFEERWNVSWTPYNNGPYPDFAGELHVGMAKDNVAFVELAGAYDPPLGRIGAAFDVVAGSRIAAVTARSLVQRIAAEIDRSYRETEQTST